MYWKICRNKWTLLGALCLVIVVGCKDETFTAISSVQYTVPNYGLVGIEPEGDTLQIVLNDTSFHDIGFVNYFIGQGNEYLSISDNKSAFINVYQISTGQLVSKVLLKKLIPQALKYQTSIYCRNFDSIFVSDRNKVLYRIDSSGAVKEVMDFPIQPQTEVGVFPNFRPLVLKSGIFYFGVFPSNLVSYKNGLKQWKPLYSFDMREKRSDMYYGMPPKYRDQLYDFRFYNYSYCINDQGMFVFSFPADSSLYLTDLVGINIAHNGRSQFQSEDIEPEREEELKNGGGTKQYRIRDSYGPVFYDPYRRRYLRLFTQKLTEEEFAAGVHERKQNVVIFNDSLHIIGESSLPEDISFGSFFQRTNGQMYVRVNKRNKNVLQFVRLRYSDKKPPCQGLAQQKK